jgi:predicted RNase H-like HicB family nuclease
MHLVIPVYVKSTECGDFAAVAPDIPHSFARGNTPEEAIDDMHAWLLARWKMQLEFGEDVNIFVSPIEGLRERPDFQGGEWRKIEVDLLSDMTNMHVNLVVRERRRWPRLNQSSKAE